MTAAWAWHRPCVCAPRNESVHEGRQTMKFLTVLALAGLLAGCGLGATTPSGNPLPTIGQSAAASASASASTGESPTAMSCSEAFADIDTAAIVAMGQLDALSDELDTT